MMGPAIARTFQGDFVNRHRTSIVVTIKFLLLTLAYAPAQAAEPFACLDLARAFDPQADLSSLQLNSQLFRAATRPCGARRARGKTSGSPEFSFRRRSTILKPSIARTALRPAGRKYS